MPVLVSRSPALISRKQGRTPSTDLMMSAPAFSLPLQSFDDYLQASCTQLSGKEREAALSKWESAPGARMVRWPKRRAAVPCQLGVAHPWLPPQCPAMVLPHMTPSGSLRILLRR